MEDFAISINEFQPEDTKIFIPLLHEQLGFKESETSLEKRIVSCLQTTDQLTIFLAKRSHAEAVGYILIQWLHELWTDSPEAFISNFYVKEKWRQKKVGSRLLEAAIQEVKKRNCARLFLENNRDNLVYQKKFYPKRGWIERTDISIFEFPKVSKP